MYRSIPSSGVYSKQFSQISTSSFVVSTCCSQYICEQRIFVFSCQSCSCHIGYLASRGNVYDCFTKNQRLHHDFSWNSTGAAGLIQMIALYVHGHIAAGVVSTVSTAGWVVQGLGNAFYYYQVVVFSCFGSVRRLTCPRIRYGTITMPLVTRSQKYVF